MELKTDSGIKILISDNGSSKVVVFDELVKAIELTKEESSRLGASLIRDKKTGITPELRKLIESGFFSSPRRFRAIFTELHQKGIPVKSASLNMVLSKMVERKELKRNGQRRSYLYLT